MGSNTLTSERRSQLSSIVEKMEANKETASDIQLVVDHFKTKYSDAPEVVPDKEQGSSVGERIASGVGAVVGGPLGEMALKAGYRTVSDVVDNPKDAALGALGALPMAGAIGGTFAGSGFASIPLAGLGAAGGEAFNQIGRRALGVDPTRDVPNPLTGEKFGRIPGTSQELSNILQEGGVSSAIQALGLGAVKGWQQLAKGVSALQKVSAGSALGGMKNVYNKISGGSKAFNESAVALQEKGVFGPFTQPETMLKHVETISKTAGEKIGQTLQQIDDAGVVRIRANAVAKSLYDDLKKGFNTGYAKRINQEAGKIFATIKGYGDDITFKQLQDIKTTINPGKWGDFQMSGMGEDARKIFEIRQRAVGKLGKIIEDGVSMAEIKSSGQLSKNQKLLPGATPGSGSTLGKTLFDEYKDAKRVYGDAQNIIKGLNDKIARLEGKQFVGLGEIGAGIGAISNAFGGDSNGAAKWLATAAGIKYLRSFGPQQGALLFKTIAKTSLPQQTVTAVLQALRSGGGNKTDRQ